MFGTKSSERKLKVNLGLTVTRLKLQEKKKTGLALRARPEIAEYCRIAKTDRARVRVESIIREDYLVEAMELVEMYADLLQSRLGLLQAGNLHESLRKPVATLIWSTPRLAQFCQELQIVQKLLGDLFGKKFIKACEANEMDYVCERVIAKLDPKPPKAALVERYLIEICKSADVNFTPDANALAEELFDKPPPSTDFMEFNQNFQGPPGGPGAPPSGPGGFGAPGGPGGFGGGDPRSPGFGGAPRGPGGFGGAPGGPGGFGGDAPGGPGGFGGGAPGGGFGGGSGGGGSTDPTFSYAAPAFPQNPSNTNVAPQQPSFPVYNNDSAKVEPGPGVEEKQAPPLPSKSPAGAPEHPSNQQTAYPPPYSGHPNVAAPPATQPQAPQMPVLPDLPSVPPSFMAPGSGVGSNSSSGDVDFDDLSRRFQNLRKKT